MTRLARFGNNRCLEHRSYFFSTGAQQPDTYYNAYSHVEMTSYIPIFGNIVVLYFGSVSRTVRLVLERSDFVAGYQLLGHLLRISASYLIPNPVKKLITTTNVPQKYVPSLVTGASQSSLSLL